MFQKQNKKKGEKIMGTYDTYGEEGIQLKTGPCDMLHYDIGDKVDISDGVHLAYDGIVVVKNGILIETFNITSLYTKWGHKLDIEEIINPINPIKQACDKIIEEKELVMAFLKKERKRKMKHKDKVIICKIGEVEIGRYFYRGNKYIIVYDKGKKKETKSTEYDPQEFLKNLLPLSCRMFVSFLQG